MKGVNYICIEDSAFYILEREVLVGSMPGTANLISSFIAGIEKVT